MVYGKRKGEMKILSWGGPLLGAKSKPFGNLVAGLFDDGNNFPPQYLIGHAKGWPGNGDSSDNSSRIVPDGNTDTPYALIVFFIIDGISPLSHLFQVFDKLDLINDGIGRKLPHIV